MTTCWVNGRVTRELPDLPAGIYQHYKGHLYHVLGYGSDSNYEGRVVVIYFGIELHDARKGPRLHVRTVEDFFAIVDVSTGKVIDQLEPTTLCPRRFTYLGTEWTPDDWNHTQPS